MIPGYRLLWGVSGSHSVLALSTVRTATLSYFQPQALVLYYFRLTTCAKLLSRQAALENQTMFFLVHFCAGNRAPRANDLFSLVKIVV